ncbi:hypothetical protein ACQ4WP_26845 [Janthinobacterium sp. GB4P2]|uniref:hypothetical protein n=1 Tax=Janthinobacterium sp. GB4P2 TaxID=3424189 RepID=UPI003F26065B
MENVRIGPWNSNTNNGTPIVIESEQPYDEQMSAPTEKDYINAKLEAAAAKADGRLEALEARIDGRLASIESKMDTKFAELRTDMHKGTAELVKWVVGTAIAMAAVAITVMTFVLNNAVPKAPAAPPAQPQPIVIYAQPAPPAAAPPAPAAKP